LSESETAMLTEIVKELKVRGAQEMSAPPGKYTQNHVFVLNILLLTYMFNLHSACYKKPLHDS